jgi:hypothetical protein
MAEILRAKTGAERLQISWAMGRAMRRILTQSLTREHPDWSPEKVQKDVSRRVARGEVPRVDLKVI